MAIYYAIQKLPDDQGMTAYNDSYRVAHYSTFNFSTADFQ